MKIRREKPIFIKIGQICGAMYMKIYAHVIVAGDINPYPAKVENMVSS